MQSDEHVKNRREDYLVTRIYGGLSDKVATMKLGGERVKRGYSESVSHFLKWISQASCNHGYHI